MKGPGTQVKIFFGFVFAFLCVGIFSWITYSNMQLTSEDSKEVDNALQILKPVENTWNNVQDIETSYRGFLIAGKEKFLVPFNMALKEIPRNLASLQNASGNDEVRRADADLLTRLTYDKVQHGKNLLQAKRNKNTKVIAEAINRERGQQLMDSIRSLVQKIETRERAVLNTENLVKRERAKKTSFLFILLSVVVLVFLVTSFMIIRFDFQKRKRGVEQIAYLATLVSNVHDAIFSTDNNFVIKTWNKGAEQIYGWPAEEAIGKTVDGLMLTDYGDTAVEKLVEDFRRNGFFKSEVIQKNKEGETLYIAVSSSVIRDEHGLQTGAVSVNKNITERRLLETRLKELNRELEEQVREKTSELKNIFNTLDNSFWGFDAIQNKMLYVSPGTKKVYGYDEQAFLDNPLLWSEVIVPDDKHTLDPLYREINKGNSAIVEYRITHFDGSIRWIEGRMTPTLDGSGKLIRLDGVALDISSRKKAGEELAKSELRYRSLIEQASDAIMVTDMNGNFLDVNETLCRMFNYSKNELMEMNISRLLEPEQLKQRPIAFERLSTGEQTFNERKMIDRLGKVIEVEANVKKFGDDMLLAIARDVTERKKAENLIKESEARYRAFFENSMDGILLTVADGEIMAANQSACKIFGMTEEEICRAGRFGLVDMTDPRVYMLIKERQRTGKAEGEITLLRKDGTKFPGEISSAVFKNIYGEERTSMIVRDITERKKIESKLQESEAGLKEAQRLAHIGNWDLDLVTNRLKWSDEVYRIFGLEYDEFSATLEAFIDRVHPEDRKFVSEAYDRSIKEKSNYDIIHRIITKDGTVKYVNERCETYYDEMGTPVRSIGTVQDITGRKKAEEEVKESEEKYRYLFNNNPALIFIWDLETLKILEVNETALQEYGYTRNQVLGMTVLDLRAEEDHARIKDFAKNILENNKYPVRSTWRHLKKNGEMMYMDISSHRIEYKNRRAILSLAKNVTEQLLAEELLKKTHEDIRLLNSHLQSIREEERTSIAREIHDELGQQLTGLKMDASWLRKKISTEDPVAQAKISDMISLLDETVKTVRRISTELRPGILDDLGLVDALDWQSTEFEKRTGIRCLFKSASGEMQFEKNLSTGIFRVYQETLTNVARHSKASEIRATLEQNGDDIILKVEDNGKGFDEAATKNKNTLGLIGMKERATMFGGKLTIESKIGKGTTIHLQIPLKIAPGTTDA